MDEPVDWAAARRTALRFADKASAHTPGAYRSLSSQMADLTAQAEELVTIQTGLVPLQGPARAKVANRAMWIDANLASFQRLMRPLVAKLAPDEEKTGFLADRGRQAAGAQMGVILGWMSGRVLGQYDLLIIEDDKPEDQDIVYYVAPNLLAIEAKHDFPADEFRLWLALHEVTHRAQFTGVPWMREYFLSLVNETLDTVDADPDRLKTMVGELLTARKEGKDVLTEGGIAQLLASPEQRETIDKISGLMSLLEGHGDITMDRAGVDFVPSAPRFGKVLRDRRKSAKGFQAFLQKVLGIEAKLNQYAAGENFIEEVEKVGGTGLVDRAWEAPENLPSMTEINEPQLWVERLSDIAAPVAQ